MVRIQQGAFSLLPDLTDEQIKKQIEYCIKNSFAVGLEYTDDCHPRNCYCKGGPYMVRDTLPVPNAQPGGDPMGPPGSGMAAMPGAAAAAAMPGMAGRRLSQAGGMAGMSGMGAMPPAGSKPAASMPGKGMGAMPPAASKPAGSIPGMAGPAASKPTVIPLDAAMATMSAPVKPAEFGYTVVRLVADNPGPWAWHCHIDPHAASGMFFALRVGRQWDVPEGLNACAAAKAPGAMGMGMRA